MSTPWRVGHLAEPLTGRSWDPATVAVEVAKRVDAFLASGIEPGNRVLIHFGNNLEFFAELLATWQVGACAIPVDARLTAFEVEKLAQAAKAQFSVIDDATPETIRDTVSDVHVRHTLNLQPAPKADRPPSRLRLDDDALILFTSGSTGEPKGVVHTHRSLLARWTTLRQSLHLDAYARTLCVLPTHFGHGLICNCLYPWLNGRSLFIAPPFQAELIMRLGKMIDEHGITFMSSVPSVWNLALKTAAAPAAGQLRRVHVGSAPLSANVWTQIQEWTGTKDVFNAYGITETGSWTAGTTGEAVVPESGLVGQPWGAEVKITTSDGDGLSELTAPACEPGTPGMVWLHTPALMKGYFQRPDLTNAAIHHGWFMTGDIGFIDDRGRLFLKGRERDEINKGGMKVFPADVDEIVEQFRATTDVCTFGFEDAFYGENVGIAVVLEDEGTETLKKLHAWVQSHLAENKHPVRWYVLKEIPRTSRGKINRDNVREVCEHATPLDLRQLLSDAADKGAQS